MWWWLDKTKMYDRSYFQRIVQFRLVSVNVTLEIQCGIINYINILQSERSDLPAPVPDCVKVYPKCISPFFLTGMFRLGSCTITNPAELATEINKTRNDKTNAPHPTQVRPECQRGVSRTQLAWNSNVYPVKNMRTVRADMKTSRLVVESSASCTSLTRQSCFTPLTALRFHSKHTQTLRFRLRRQSAPRLRGKNWTYVAASCRRASKKNSPNCKYTPPSLRVSLQGLSVNTSGSNPHVRSFSSFFFAFGGMRIVFLNVKLLSLSPPPFFFLLPMCQKFQTFLQNGVPGLEECHVILDPTLDRPIMGLSYLSAQGWEGETSHFLKGDSLLTQAG